MNKKFSVLIKNKITKFSKTILVENDKSISHRALLIASQCMGPSNIKGILESGSIILFISLLFKLLSPETLTFKFGCVATNAINILAKVPEFPT